jgi:hypothetical protein
MIDGLEIVRKANARRMKLSVDPRTGQVRLVLPHKAPLAAALTWAEQHEGWIARQKARMPEPWPIEPGMAVPIGGASYTLDWAQSHPRTPRIEGAQILIGGPIDVMSNRLQRWLKAEARTLLDQETREIAAQRDISIATVSVGDPRSRWGSCSGSGDIRYSWRLILAPDFVRRATVAHEVAHRIHMDHSRDFHRLAKELFGADHAPARDWLRHNGARLYWFGRGG